ncbi:MAG: hypothetical protein FWE04_04335 [Oscillospiraceae bacterium]|nr:hypothetical protein [Oscillospiraceae bacterium]
MLKKIISLSLVVITLVVSVTSAFATTFGSWDSIIENNGDERAQAIRGSIAFDEEYNQLTMGIAVVASVIVDGVEFEFDAFAIRENNYFKLRDLAYILNGTQAQFEIGFDVGTNTVSLASGQPYTIVGGEMLNNHRGFYESGINLVTSAARPSDWNFMLDGEEITFTAYDFGGNNFIKLRDVAAALNFFVDWDGRIIIDTGRRYEL